MTDERAVSLFWAQFDGVRPGPPAATGTVAATPDRERCLQWAANLVIVALFAGLVSAAGWLGWRSGVRRR